MIQPPRNPRGQYGFRFQCAMPDCKTSKEVWSAQQVNTHADLPEGWVIGYNDIFCPDHVHVPGKHNTLQKAWSDREREIMQVPRKGVRELYKKFCEENPYPTAPWDKTLKRIE